jgi:hypothetical protein
MIQLPESPWKKGKFNDHTTFVLDVLVCEVYQEGVRSVYTQHDFQSEQDRELAQGLLSAGEEQIAHALLCNAIRREAFLESLIQMQRDTTVLAKYRDASPEDRRKIELTLAANVSNMLNRTVCKMAPDISREILEMLLR